MIETLTLEVPKSTPATRVIYIYRGVYLIFAEAMLPETKSTNGSPFLMPAVQ